MQTLSLSGGFAYAPTQSAVAFRQIMNAMAKPGEILHLEGATPPAPLSTAAGTVLLTLCDTETPLFLAQSVDTDAVRDWITFHTGAPLTNEDQAMFAVGPWSELPIRAFQLGTPEYPDRSTTLIVELAELVAAGNVLEGPGIEKTSALCLPETKAFQLNAGLYPLGLDFLFTQGDRVAALPRTTKVI